MMGGVSMNRLQIIYKTRLLEIGFDVQTHNEIPCELQMVYGCNVHTGIAKVLMTIICW